MGWGLFPPCRGKESTRPRAHRATALPRAHRGSRSAGSRSFSCAASASSASTASLIASSRLAVGSSASSTLRLSAPAPAPAPRAAPGRPRAHAAGAPPVHARPRRCEQRRHAGVVHRQHRRRRKAAPGSRRPTGFRSGAGAAARSPGSAPRQASRRAARQRAPRRCRPPPRARRCGVSSPAISASSVLLPEPEGPRSSTLRALRGLAHPQSEAPAMSPARAFQANSRPCQVQHQAIVALSLEVKVFLNFSTFGATTKAQ